MLALLLLCFVLQLQQVVHLLVRFVNLSTALALLLWELCCFDFCCCCCCLLCFWVLLNRVLTVLHRS